jgi:hypothetical protein
MCTPYTKFCWTIKSLFFAKRRKIRNLQKDWQDLLPFSLPFHMKKHSIFCKRVVQFMTDLAGWRQSTITRPSKQYVTFFVLALSFKYSIKKFLGGNQLLICMKESYLLLANWNNLLLNNQFYLWIAKIRVELIFFNGFPHHPKLRCPSIFVQTRL